MMLCVAPDWRLRMLFSIIFRAQAKNERREHKSDHFLFLGCENEAMMNGG
jgi:hypothetical protein